MTKDPLREYGIHKERSWIPMQDGIQLAVDIWSPVDADAADRFPVVLEYLPYRMDDGSLRHDHEMGCYIVRHGICYARVDIRGTGASEGILPPGQYSEQEMADGMQVIDWLSRQPWSNGNVGMWGISWGGYNTVQMARQKPPALKAIIAIMPIDDAFMLDSYFDGLMCVAVGGWGLYADHLTSLSPAPDFPIDEKTLAARFDQPPWIPTWIHEQRDGPFWRRQALGRDYEGIEIPTMLIEGWYDGQQDAVARMLERMTAPVKAIVGPWSHALPHEDLGPQIEWRHEAVRWWTQWLKGEDTGIMNEPKLSVFVRHWHPPDPGLTEFPGAWRGEDGLPIERRQELPYYLGPDRALSSETPLEATQQLGYVPSIGTTVPSWWGGDGAFPDPRPDDAFSLTFDSEPLEQDLEILGFPRAELRAAADAPLLHWFVRLADVAPDGVVTTVSGAGLNGAQRESRTDPAPLEPGVVYPLRFDLRFTSWVFPKGHRIRVSVLHAWWPAAWPSPYPAVSTLHVGGHDGSRVVLPAIPYEDRPVPSFLPPDPCPPPAIRIIDSGAGADVGGNPNGRSLARDADGTAVMTSQGEQIIEYPWGRELKRSNATWIVNDHRPDEAKFHADTELEAELEDRQISWRSTLDLESTLSEFLYRFRRELRLNGLTIRERNWEERIPRDYQ